MDNVDNFVYNSILSQKQRDRPVDNFVYGWGKKKDKDICHPLEKEVVEFGRL